MEKKKFQNFSDSISIWAIFLLSSHFCGTTSQNCSKFWYVVKHKKASLQKNFELPPSPSLSVVPIWRCKITPFFAFFYLFSYAHYSKQNWYFLIQRPPKSWFFFLNQRDTLFCNPYFSRWLKRNEILGNSSKADLLQKYAKNQILNIKTFSERTRKVFCRPFNNRSLNII